MPLYKTQYGVGELVSRSHRGLEVRLMWGGTVFVEDGGGAPAVLVAPPGSTPTHPQFSSSIPHAVPGGWSFSLPPAFLEPAPTPPADPDDDVGMVPDAPVTALWEEHSVRPELMEELANARALPSMWSSFLAADCRAQLTPLQTTVTVGRLAVSPPRRLPHPCHHTPFLPPFRALATAC